MGRGGGHKRGVPLTASAKKKISDALRGRKHPHRGHPMTAETRAKLSEAAKKRAAARGRAASSPRHVSTRHPGTSQPRGHQVHGTARPAKKGLTLKATLRTHRFHAGAHRLITTARHRPRVALIHGPRRHRHRIVIHRRVRAHHVWRKRKG